MEVFYVVINAIRFIFLVMNLTGNSLVILTIVKVKSLQGPTTILLNCLAFSDLSVGFAIALGYGFSNLYGEDELKVKSESFSFGLEFYSHALMSSWTLVAIAIERYLAVMKPFYHRAHVTKKALYKTMILLCLLPVPLVIPSCFIRFFYQGLGVQVQTVSNFSLPNSSLAGFNHSDYSFDSSETLVRFGYEVFQVISCSALPALFMAYFYGRIIHNVWFKPSSQQGTNTGILKTRRKLTKLLLTVTVVFYLCWMPLFVTLSGQITEKAKMVCVLFPLLSTTINPIIYSFHSKPFRKGIKSLFTCCCRKKRVHVEKSTGEDVSRTKGCCCCRSWTVLRGNGNGLENACTVNETRDA